MESAHFLKTGALLNLSEQQLVDCIPEFAGCNGGNEVGGMQYILKNGGVSSGLAYPYVSGVTLQNGTCKSVVSCFDTRNNKAMMLAPRRTRAVMFSSSLQSQRSCTSVDLSSSLVLSHEHAHPPPSFLPCYCCLQSSAASISAFAFVPPREKLLAAAVSQQPVTVAIEVDPSFQLYTGVSVTWHVL